MRRGDRTRFHQRHRVKVAVDWGTAAIAGTLLWRHDWVAAVTIGVVPSNVTTAVFLSGRFDDALGKMRDWPRARSIAEGLSLGINAVRFGGLAIAWVGCWLQRPWWIPAGLWRTASPRNTPPEFWRTTDIGEAQLIEHYFGFRFAASSAAFFS